MKTPRSRLQARRSPGARPPVAASTHRLLLVLASFLTGAGCTVGAVEEIPDDADDAELGELAAAGASDRYSCITTSQPGCNFAIGLGASLFGAGECHSGVDFHVSSRDADRSHPVILAIHGGKIEDGTGQLASQLVAALGWDYYVFHASPTSDTCDAASWMHVTSTRFNSSTARSLALSHPSALSLHGYNENNASRSGWPTDRWFICVGGSNATARARFIASINSPSFSIDGRRVRAVDATTAGSASSTVCGGLGGTGSTNIANLPPGGGLQLELPRRLRARIAGLDGLSSNATLRSRLVTAVRAAL